MNIMKRQLFAAAATFAASLMMAPLAHAACAVDVTDPFELDAAAIDEIYTCLKDEMAEKYAKDVAAEQYLKFATEGVDMPAGSILAKESISISKKKKEARTGPLFIMTKGEEGAAPDAGDWVYSALMPNGKPMKISQSFCHDCHVSWEAQDMLAYPLEEVRVSN